MMLSDLQIARSAYCTIDNTCQSSTWPGEQASLSDNGSERDSEGRLRFTLAHEIGHWICHSQGEAAPPVLCRSEDVGLGADRLLEREANVFAAELLMPELAVRDVFARTSRLDEVARAFYVSPQAMHWRLPNFGLIANKPE
jgi:Zn-dependent peptidase ImmA (M78 family)